MQRQIMAMLQLQNSMNTRVNSEWRSAGNAWYRAIWVECAELLEHYGWKWWKAQKPDMDQVILELVDIWHFGLSIELETSQNLEEISASIQSRYIADSRSTDIRAAVEAFASTTLISKGFDIQGFATLAVLAGLEFDELYRRYVGKNVLNFFRQDHGYKEGTYQKIWAGKEDNEHLMELLAGLDLEAEDFQRQVYQALDQRYPA